MILINNLGAFNSLLVREDGDVVYVGSDRGYINIWDLRYASSAVGVPVPLLI